MAGRKDVTRLLAAQARPHLLHGLVHVLITHRGALKHSCYSRPHNEGVDSATMFGDFFFVEALCRVALPGGLRPEHSDLA